MRDEIRRLATVSSGMAELTLNKAESLARDLAERAGLSPDQVSSLGQELLERASENRREVTALIRSEIRGQLTGLGVANRHEIEGLERRVARLEERVRLATLGDEVVAAQQPVATRRKPVTPKKPTARRKAARKKPTARGKTTSRQGGAAARAQDAARRSATGAGS